MYHGTNLNYLSFLVSLVESVMNSRSTGCSAVESLEGSRGFANRGANDSFACLLFLWDFLWLLLIRLTFRFLLLKFSVLNVPLLRTLVLLLALFISQAKQPSDEIMLSSSWPPPDTFTRNFDCSFWLSDDKKLRILFKAMQWPLLDPEPIAPIILSSEKGQISKTYSC